MNVLIVTGGTIDKEFAKEVLEGHKFDKIIAADAGLGVCHALSIMPTEILGDFDSLSNKALLRIYKDKGIPLKEFPVRKDYTDTHLAMLYAKDLHPDHVIILGATGTRYDHAMANIGLLSMMADDGIDCRILDPNNEIMMLKGRTRQSFSYSAKRPYCSLLAMSKEVTGITLTGFSYPLKDAIMHCFDSLGISNEIVEQEGTVQIESGYLLIIRSRD